MNSPVPPAFESLVKPGGKLILNTSLVNERPTRTDIECIEVPCNDLAEELGNRRTANVIMYGALVAETGVVPPKALITHSARSSAARRQSTLTST
jgi:2-oxoglutarate ferredoxin oxidoreductase subunit gamma